MNGNTSLPAMEHNSNARFGVTRSSTCAPECRRRLCIPAYSSVLYNTIIRLSSAYVYSHARVITIIAHSTRRVLHACIFCMIRGMCTFRECARACSHSDSGARLFVWTPRVLLYNYRTPVNARRCRVSSAERKNRPHNRSRAHTHTRAWMHTFTKTRTHSPATRMGTIVRGGSDDTSRRWRAFKSGAVRKLRGGYPAFGSASTHTHSHTSTRSSIVVPACVSATPQDISHRHPTEIRRSAFETVSGVGCLSVPSPTT